MSRSVIRSVMWLALLAGAAGASAGGCGNVYLRGEAMTAVETSTMDAYQALGRATTQPADGPEPPAWQRAYLQENFCQWRWFARAAKKDLTWGPKLAGE